MERVIFNLLNSPLIFLPLLVDEDQKATLQLLGLWQTPLLQDTQHKPIVLLLICAARSCEQQREKAWSKQVFVIVQCDQNLQLRLLATGCLHCFLSKRATPCLLCTCLQTLLCAVCCTMGCRKNDACEGGSGHGRGCALLQTSCLRGQCEVSKK